MFARSGSELAPARSVTYSYQVNVDCDDMYIGSSNYCDPPKVRETVGSRQGPNMYIDISVM